MKIKHNEYQDKHALAVSLLTEEEKAQGSQSKLKYAIQKIENSVKSGLVNLQEQVNEIVIEYASEDPETKILKMDARGQYEYTKENALAKLKKVNELNLSEIEVTPYYFKDAERIATFDLFTVEELTGFLFEPTE